MNEITNLAPPNLHAVYVWGIEVIRAVQMLLPSSLDLVIRILSDALVYGFALVPLTYIWCADYKKGLHLFYLFVFGLGLNEGLKLFLQVPRPYTQAPDILKIRASAFSTVTKTGAFSQLRFSFLSFLHFLSALRAFIWASIILPTFWRAGLSAAFWRFVLSS